MSQPEKILTIADSITVGELAETLNLPVTQLVGELFKNGIVATINRQDHFTRYDSWYENGGRRGWWHYSAY